MYAAPDPVLPADAHTRPNHRCVMPLVPLDRCSRLLNQLLPDPSGLPAAGAPGVFQGLQANRALTLELLAAGQIRLLQASASEFSITTLSP